MNGKPFFKNSRVLLMRLLARFHCALLMAVLCAAFYEFLHSTGVFHPALTPMQAYLRGLLFCIPIALSYYAAERLPALWQYLLASLLICGLSWFLLGHPGGAAAAAFVCLLRGRARLSEEKERSAFDAPSLIAMVLFLAAFLVSAIQGMALLQRLSVISAAVYLLIFLFFRGLEELEDYLALNRDMAGLPARRIRRISGGALAAAVLISGLLLLPAAFEASGEFRIALPDREKSHAAVTQPKQEAPAVQGPSLAELLGDDEENAWTIPPVVSYLLYALFIGGLSVLAMYTVYQLFRHFRASYTDSRDVVQFLGEAGGEEEKELGRSRRRPAFLDRSPNAAIRRRYRKWVLRAAPEPPRRWQTPEEIEKSASLSEPQLHGLYEKARYGPAPCTAEDLRALKEMGKKG